MTTRRKFIIEIELEAYRHFQEPILLDNVRFSLVRYLLERFSDNNPTMHIWKWYPETLKVRECPLGFTIASNVSWEEEHEPVASPFSMIRIR